jgi:SAM-dependent methyltransferase
MKIELVPSSWEARLASDQETVFSRFLDLCDLRGASVLEIGGLLGTDLVAAAGVAAWWAVDPRNPEGERHGAVRSLRGRASSVPLPDASLDCAFSSNAFQHVHDLPETLTELARVLRPGGLVYANYGPVWSGPDGSHIEELIWEGKRYDFWDQSLLPSWSHLVFDEGELAAFLEPLHGVGLAGAVARYVHRSDWINRLFFDDYARIFAESPFQVVAFGGCPALDYEYRPPAIAHPLSQRLSPERLAAEVQARHGRDKRDLQSRDIEVVLRLA